MAPRNAIGGRTWLETYEGRARPVPPAPTFYKPAGLADLTVRDDPRPPAQSLACAAAIGDRIDHPLSLDFMFHLPECRHDREQHGPHRSRRVDVAAVSTSPRFSTRRPAPRPRNPSAKASMFCVDSLSRSRVVMMRVWP